MASTKKNDTKVDRAFEVIERLENDEKKRAAAKAGKTETPGEKSPAKRSGLQFRFSMDALVSDKDKRGFRDDDFRSGESNLLNFKITVPYIWRIPVIGPTALKLVRRIQSEEYPESIKDILKSLKKKKPL